VFVLVLLCSLMVIEAAPQRDPTRRRNGGRRRSGGNGNRRRNNWASDRASPWGFRGGSDHDGFGRNGRDVSHVLDSVAALPPYGHHVALE